MNPKGNTKLMKQLGEVMLDPISLGKVKTPSVKCKELWKDKTAIIFAIRRPG